MDHNYLVKRAGKWLRNSQRCRVVATELHAGDTLEIPDAIGWKYDGTSILVECKVSVSDFKHDKYKVSRKAGAELGVGQIRVYFVSKEVADALQPKDIPDGWGLYVVGAKQVRKKVDATRQVLSSESMRREMVMLGTIIATEQRDSLKHLPELTKENGFAYFAQARTNNWKDIQRFISAVRKQVLIPFCDEHHIKFIGKKKFCWYFMTFTKDKFYINYDLLNHRKLSLLTMPKDEHIPAVVIPDAQDIIHLLELKTHHGATEVVGDRIGGYAPKKRKK